MRACAGQVEWRVWIDQIDHLLARSASFWSLTSLILQLSPLVHLVHIQPSLSLVQLVHIQPSLMPLHLVHIQPSLMPFKLVHIQQCLTPLQLVPIQPCLPPLQLVPIKPCLTWDLYRVRTSVGRILCLLQLSRRCIGALSCEPLLLPARWSASGRCSAARLPSLCTWVGRICALCQAWTLWMGLSIGT